MIVFDLRGIGLLVSSACNQTLLYTRPGEKVSTCLTENIDTSPILIIYYHFL